ncbi:MAG TPA: cupin domain-containing protein [Candidatus Sulfotelmatobacter sp.]|nr:cupin domain-containing protein [Candidatus Sulfotelmatobacter sp.]
MKAYAPRLSRSATLCDEGHLAAIKAKEVRADIVLEDNMRKVNIAEKFSKITEYWKPYVGAELNGQMVKFDKIKGEFVFHHHENEDELFLVVKGRFRMEFRDHHEWIEEGEFIVVPRGVEHRPVADEECWFLLFEPASTLNTGNVVNERTVAKLDRV